MQTLSNTHLRIMQVMGTGDQYGGLERHFFDLCNQLSQNHEVIAVCHPAHASRLSKEVHFESLGKRIGRRNPFTLFRMASLLRHWHPDVVHTHANLATEIVSTIRGVTSARRVATVHGLKKRHHAFRHCHQIIAVSQGVAESVPFQNVVVVKNGIRRPTLAPEGNRSWIAREFQLAADVPIAVSVGRLVPEKGFDLLLEAWRDISAQLVIVGEGPLRPQLERQIEKEGLGQKVRLAGFRTDVPALLDSADLKVIASRREGFPYTLIEALMHRKIIVSTDVPGAEDFVPSPFLVPRFDVSALQQCLQKTLADLDKARMEFEPAWEQAARELTLEAMTANILRTYVPAQRAA